MSALRPLAALPPVATGRLRHREPSGRRCPSAARGNPSPRSAMALRCISSVPPPMRRPGREQEPLDPGSGVRVVGQGGRRPEDRHGGLGRESCVLGVEQLRHRASGRDGVARGDSRHQEVQDTFAGDRGRDGLAHDGIARASEIPAESDQLARGAGARAAADGGPFAGQHRPQDLSAGADRTDQRVLGHEDVVEEHLVEVVAARHLPQRPDLDPRVRHVDDQARQPLVP